MKITYKVTYDDGREVVAIVKPKDLVAFERQFGMSFADSERVEHVYYLAWSALHRAGVELRAFDEFLDFLDDVEEKEDAAPAVPFPQDQSAEELSG